MQTAAVRSPSASAATVWQPGQILRAVYGIFVSNGTSGSPNAGLLVGNGYSYSSFDTQCVGSFVCDGGRGGLLLGAGGNGYNGGNGGNAGLFFGTVFLPGNGGAGSSTCSGAACTTGSGGNALLIGPGGSGGNGADAVYDSTTGALISAATAGGTGGNGGLIWGIGGAGGYGGADNGSATVSGATAANGGDGGRAGLIFGTGGAGGVGGYVSFAVNGNAVGGNGGNGGRAVLFSWLYFTQFYSFYHF